MVKKHSMHEKKLMNKQLNNEKRQNFHDIHLCHMYHQHINALYIILFLMLALCHMMVSCYYKSTIDN